MERKMEGKIVQQLILKMVKLDSSKSNYLLKMI